jgi:hypothetical protein
MRPQVVTPAGAFVFAERSVDPSGASRWSCHIKKACILGITEDRWMLPRKRRPKVPYGHPAQVTVSPNR